MKILFAVLLVFVAQVPSCGPNEAEQPIVGFVEDKYLVNVGTGHSQPAIVIHSTEYIVPMDFYREVGIGDLVKLENGRWILVRKAYSNRWDPGSSKWIPVRS